MKRFLFIINMMLITSFAYGSEPKIVETENGFVVEYTGTPEVKKDELGRDGLTKSQREEISRELETTITRLKGKVAEAERQIQERQNRPKLEDDIKVSSVKTIELERAYNYVTYSIKVDIDNKGEHGEVFVRLIGRNREGYEIHSLYLSGIIERHGSRTLTSTTMLTFQQAMDVRTWEVASVNKYNK